MDEVYPRQIEIFRVPAEEGLPASQIAVRRVDAFDFVGQRVAEQRIEGVEVPALAARVHQRV